jgi:hypothetical protein
MTPAAKLHYAFDIKQLEEDFEEMNSKRRSEIVRTATYSLLLVVGTFLIINAALRVKGMFFQDDATLTLGVQSESDYKRPTEAAMDIWNGFVGCKFLVEGTEVRVKADDGEPCGDPWRPEAEWDHDATAYDCDDEPWSEVVVSRPGDIHTQTCIIAHELGHVMGMPHRSFGAMSSECGDMIRIADADVKALKRQYCE